MSKPKIALLLLAMLFVYGVVGRIDREDAVRFAQAMDPPEEVRLSCLRFRVGPSAEPALPPSDRVESRFITQVDSRDSDDPLPPEVLRCIVIDHQGNRHVWSSH